MEWGGRRAHKRQVYSHHLDSGGEDEAAEAQCATEDEPLGPGGREASGDAEQDHRQVGNQERHQAHRRRLGALFRRHTGDRHGVEGVNLVLP